ncbi:hypothetical protein GW17_00013013, partial [Ensete ventricosum]
MWRPTWGVLIRLRVASASTSTVADDTWRFGDQEHACLGRCFGSIWIPYKLIYISAIHAQPTARGCFWHVGLCCRKKANLDRDAPTRRLYTDGILNYYAKDNSLRV